MNLSSAAGLVGSPGNPAYTAAKHGVIGLTKAAAIDYGHAGIRVNAVVPGVTDTPMTAGVPPEWLEKLQATIPLKRVANAEEIASAVLWLCSPQSSYATGSTLVVDGGYTSQ